MLLDESIRYYPSHEDRLGIFKKRSQKDKETVPMDHRESSEPK